MVGSLAFGEGQVPRKGKIQAGASGNTPEKESTINVWRVQLPYDPIRVLSKQAVALKTDIKHRGYFMWTKHVSIIRINRQLPPFQIFYVRLRDTLAFRGGSYDNAHENLNHIL